jgi:hypothetical protein
MRRDVSRVVNELAAGVPLYARGYVDTVRMYYLIVDYCRRHKTSLRKNSYRLDNGLFFINDEPIERVHPLPSRIMDSAATEHWEAAVLAKQYEEV